MTKNKQKHYQMRIYTPKKSIYNYYQKVIIFPKDFNYPIYKNIMEKHNQNWKDLDRFMNDFVTNIDSLDYLKDVTTDIVVINNLIEDDIIRHYIDKSPESKMITDFLNKSQNHMIIIPVSTETLLNLLTSKYSHTYYQNSFDNFIPISEDKITDPMYEKYNLMTINSLNDLSKLKTNHDIILLNLPTNQYPIVKEYYETQLKGYDQKPILATLKESHEKVPSTLEKLMSWIVGLAATTALTFKQLKTHNKEILNIIYALLKYVGVLVAGLLIVAYILLNIFLTLGTFINYRKIKEYKLRKWTFYYTLLTIHQPIALNAILTMFFYNSYQIQDFLHLKTTTIAIWLIGMSFSYIINHKSKKPYYNDYMFFDAITKTLVWLNRKKK